MCDVKPLKISWMWNTLNECDCVLEYIFVILHDIV